MEERRAVARARTHLTGSTLTAFAVTGETCSIQNLSPLGASLVFREGFAVPRRFDLFIGENSQALQAVTMWRRGNIAGVKFLQPRFHVPEVVSD